MDNVTFITNEIDGLEHAIIDRGNGEYTSMLKSTYDAMQAEHFTPNLQVSGTLVVWNLYLQNRFTSSYIIVIKPQGFPSSYSRMTGG